MPLVVPIHNPSRIINAASGDFFATGKQYLVVATLLCLQFYDENLNMYTLSIPVSSPIFSIGVIKSSDRDGIVVCLANGLVHVIVCQGSHATNSLSVSKQQVFQNKATDRPLEFLCHDETKSIAILKGDPSHLFILRGGKKVKATIHGGRWGKIFDACFLGSNKVCVVQNDPATTPQIEFYSLKSPQGIPIAPVLDSKFPLSELDPYNQLRLCPTSDGVLLYDFDRVIKFSLDGDLTPVADLCAFSVVSLDDGDALIAERSGLVYKYDPLDNQLTNMGKLETSPVNMIISGNFAFAWGNGQPTQILQLTPRIQPIRILPALGPVQEIIPFMQVRPAKVMAFTSSIFDHENYDQCFSTLSRLDFGSNALHLGTCLISGGEITRIFKPEPSIFALSSSQGVGFYECTQDGIAELASYNHFALDVETITGTNLVQVTPKYIKTAKKTLDRTTSFAAVSATHIYASHLDELCIYDLDLELLSSQKTELPITLIKVIDTMYIWATPMHLFITADDAQTTTFDIKDITDVDLFENQLVVGTNRGEVCLIKDNGLKNMNASLPGPIFFTGLDSVLVAYTANSAMAIFKSQTNGDPSQLGYEIVELNQPFGLMTALSNEVLLTTRPGMLDIWKLESQDTTSVITVGTQESIDTMVRYKNDLITAFRDSKDYHKCHLMEWSQDLKVSKILCTLLKPDEIIESTISIEFSGFSGLLVAVNHTTKDESELLLFDFANITKDPQVINVGEGMVVKMLPKESNDPAIAEVNMLKSNFMALVTIDKTGARITVYDTTVKSGNSFDVYGNDLLLFDFFEKTELCTISGTTIKHKFWLDETQETSSGVILPPTRTFPETSYLVSTETNDLYQFEVNGDEQLSEKSIEVKDRVTCMSRVSYDTKAPFIADALLGTANGGLLAYFRLPENTENSLALLSSRARSFKTPLFSDNERDSSLIFWPDIRDLPADVLERLCTELELDKSLVDQAHESVRALLY